MQDYLQTQKQKELAFRRQDLEKAIAALEGREEVGRTSLEDVEAKLTALREETKGKAAEAKVMLGESLLAMARPGSSYAALEDRVQASDFEADVLSGDLVERHQAYVKLCQGVFAELQAQLQKTNFDSIRSQLRLESMERFLAASEWLKVSLQTYFDIMSEVAARQKSLTSTTTSLQKREKQALLTLKNLADKSLGGGEKRLARLTAPNEELGEVRAKLSSAQLQTQLILAQETASVDNLLADLDRAAGETHLAITQVQAAGRQLELLTQADFTSPTQLEALLGDMLADFDPALTAFLIKEVRDRFSADELSAAQRQAFIDLLKEQRIFHRQLLDVYRRTLDQFRGVAARIFTARRDFGKDVLAFYSQDNS